MTKDNENFVLHLSKCSSVESAVDVQVSSSLPVFIFTFNFALNFSPLLIFYSLAVIMVINNYNSFSVIFFILYIRSDVLRGPKLETLLPYNTGIVVF